MLYLVNMYGVFFPFLYLQRISLEEQVYIADNLAYFNYQAQDEPLFIIHQTDIIVSVTGSNLLQSFREVLQLAFKQCCVALTLQAFSQC